MVDTAKLFDLSGRVAVVTGAASGLERAIALGLADAGADLALADIADEALDEVRVRVETVGRRVLAQRVDVTRSDDVQTLQVQTIETFGRTSWSTPRASPSARRQRTSGSTTGSVSSR